MGQPLQMDPVIRGRWCRALESGKYPQGRGVLKTADDGYCCLGVLTQLYLDEKGLGWGRGPGTPADPMNSFLPTVVAQWAGLAHANPRLVGQMSAAHINDDLRWTFPQIAEAIRTGLVPEGWHA